MDSYVCLSSSLHMYMYVTAQICSVNTERQPPMVSVLKGLATIKWREAHDASFQGERKALDYSWAQWGKTVPLDLAKSPLPTGLVESVPLWTCAYGSSGGGLSYIDLSEASWQHLGSTIQSCRVMFKGQLYLLRFLRCLFHLNQVLCLYMCVF